METQLIRLRICTVEDARYDRFDGQSKLWLTTELARIRALKQHQMAGASSSKLA